MRFWSCLEALVMLVVLWVLVIYGVFFVLKLFLGDRLYRIEEIKNKILCGDALGVLKYRTIDLVLTDPPFMIK